ncbi:MAG: FAD-linked oxidase C-terminal domain-containing protein [Gammaproteobacteria bacterium]
MLRILTELKRILPQASCITEPEAMHVYECDALTAYRRLPLAVVLPDSIEQLRAVLKLCHEAKLPVVARGAGTGLSGGALPHSEGVLLSLAKFTRILRLDSLNRTATVEPGVRNIAISEAAAPYGLHYAPDPSSQIACTIGGNVAENSGGVHCLKYGLTVHNLLALKALSITGEELGIGSQALDAPGYDLLALLTGSEGLLGIITEVTVRLVPIPQYTRVALAAFDSVQEAGVAVAAIIASGIIPAGLEMMDKLAIQAAEDFVHAGYPRDRAALLLCELDGTQKEVESQLQRVRSILIAEGAVELRVARDEAERTLFWKGRKAAFPAVGRIAPDYYCMDGTIPRHQLPRVLQGIAELSTRFGLAVANVFHAGDGNLHPLILYDANIPGQVQTAERLGGQILELCVAVGGTVTGEHGVGIEKLDQMCVQFTQPELAQFHAVKTAFDPDGLLNPGKAVPQLRRCAELGAMHVHGGRLAFPELERF